MAADHIHHLCWTDWEADGPASPVGRSTGSSTRRRGRWPGSPATTATSLVLRPRGLPNGVVNLNAWLAAEGFLAYATGGASRRKLLGESLRRYLPERLRYAAKQRLPHLRERAIERGDYTVMDWEETRVACGTFGNVVVNVRGREHGIVEPGDAYEQVRDQIAARLPRAARPRGRDHRRTRAPARGPLPWTELAKVLDLLVEFDQYAWLGKGNLKSARVALG